MLKSSQAIRSQIKAKPSRKQLRLPRSKVQHLVARQSTRPKTESVGSPPGRGLLGILRNYKKLLGGTRKCQELQRIWGLELHWLACLRRPIWRSPFQRPRTAHASRMWPLASRCVPRTGAPQGSARLSVAQFRARALGGPRRSQEVLGSPMQS